MSSILKIEFEKLRKTKSFWAIMLFLVFITSTVAITRSLEVGGSVGGINPAEPRAENGYFFEDNSAYAISLYNVWIGSISGDLFFTTIFYFILPLAATLPFSFSLSDESKSGYLRQMTLKKGQMRYYFAKYIVTFTSGFLLAAIPLLINVIITACYIPAYKPDPLEQLYSGQYYGQYLANIFYSPAFLDGYSAYDNLRYMASVKNKVSGEEIKDLLKKVELADAGKKKYKYFSLGMKQRLGIAAAIMEHPDIILIDEPTNALDSKGVEMVKCILQQEKERGALIVLTCHDYSVLKELSDSIYFIEEGRVVGYERQ